MLEVRTDFMGLGAVEFTEDVGGEVRIVVRVHFEREGCVSERSWLRISRSFLMA